MRDVAVVAVAVDGGGGEDECSVIKMKDAATFPRERSWDKWAPGGGRAVTSSFLDERAGSLGSGTRIPDGLCRIRAMGVPAAC